MIVHKAVLLVSAPIRRKRARNQLVPINQNENIPRGKKKVKLMMIVAQVTHKWMILKYWTMVSFQQRQSSKPSQITIPMKLNSMLITKDPKHGQLRYIKEKLMIHTLKMDSCHHND